MLVRRRGDADRTLLPCLTSIKGLEESELTLSTRWNRRCVWRYRYQGAALLQCIERQIDRQHVHPRFTKHAELTPFGMLRDKSLYDGRGDFSGASHSADLVRRGRRADMRIEAAS